jgi:predicted permease
VNTLLSSYTQEQLVPVLQEVERRLRSIPGVRGASAALYSPMSRSNWSHDVTIVGQPDRADHGPDDNASSGWARVMPGFFETLGDRILRGRPITDEDTARTRPVAVVNEAFARHFFGNEDPIGHHFGPASRQRAGTYEVIGVAADVRYFTEVTRPIGPMYFVPETQTTAFDEAGLEAREVWSHYPYNILIWAPGNPPGLDAQITKVLSAFDIPLYDIEPYADLVRQDFAQQTMVATLASMFAAIALALATVGLYGVTAYCVEQRTSEIGVRMALGAARRSVVVMVLREACWQLAIGLALGVPAAIGAGRLMATWLFGVTPWDPLIVTAAPLLLASAGLIAAAIPARRAASVDPARALRAQ